MNLLLVSTFVALASASCTSENTINIVGYQYLPDLAGDGLAGLATFIANQFYQDTGACVNIVYDTSAFALNTYDPPSIVNALSPGSLSEGFGYQLAEIDTITLGVMLNTSGLLQPIPQNVDFGKFIPQSVEMVTGFDGVTYYGHPSFSCSNVLYSYNDGITGVHSISELTSFISSNRGSATMGWANDLANGLDLRLEYIQGYLGSHQTTPLYPAAEDPAHLDSSILTDLGTLLGQCTDSVSGENHCADCVYYNDYAQWFGDFSSGKSFTLQGFPEYFSSILAVGNSDVNNPTHVPFTGSAIAGNGDRPYIFTDAFIVSAQNCDHKCVKTVKKWLNWQADNYAQIASLGLDLTPVRPRFLAVANQNFWSSTQVYNLPLFARDHYSWVFQEILRGVPLETLYFWATKDAQSSVLQTDVLTGAPGYVSGSC